MQATIIRVRSEQAADLSELSSQTFYDTFTGTCTEEDMTLFLQEYFNPERTQRELSNPEGYYYFAMIDNKPVGYICFMENYDSFPLMKQWKALELNRLYVLKEYHGKGIAQQLMDFMLNYATEKAYEVVWLGVWEHNIRAQKFYRKYGFEDSGHSHAFPIGNTPQTDNWYWKFL
jgi:ribosomal protein S18 acetylase RimI-like enzyme